MLEALGFDEYRDIHKEVMTEEDFVAVQEVLWRRPRPSGTHFQLPRRLDLIDLQEFAPNIADICRRLLTLSCIC